jgi:hypothetical protein
MEEEDTIVAASLPADTAAALLAALLFDDPEPYLDLDSYLDSYSSPYTRHPDAGADEFLMRGLPRLGNNWHKKTKSHNSFLCP